jgi:hypothetical protein
MTESNSEIRPIKDKLTSADSPIYRMISKTDFLPGTVGFTVFPAELEGKARVLDVATSLTDLTYLVVKPGSLSIRHYYTEDDLQYLRNLQIVLLRDLTSASVDKLITNRNGQRAERIVNTVKLLFDNLAIGPDGFLIADALNQSPTSIPRAFDQIRHETIMNKIVRATAKLDKGKKIIFLRYGFADGICYLREDIAERPDINLGSERVRQVERRVIRYLRHPNNSRALFQFVPFTEENLATETWGIRFPCELQSVQNVSFGDIPLKPKSRELLYSVLYPNRSINETNKVKISETWGWYSPFKDKQQLIPEDITLELQASLQRNFPLPHLKK